MLRVLQTKRCVSAAKSWSGRYRYPPGSGSSSSSSSGAPSGQLLWLRGLTTTGGDDKNEDEGGKFKDRSNRKLNFDRRILQPAQEGKLNAKHGSAIPRLAARRSKPHLEPVTGRAGQRGPPPTERWLDEDDEDFVPYADGDGGGGARGGGGPPMTFQEQERRRQQAIQDSVKYVMDDYDPYFAFELMNDKKYYWREEEFEQMVEGDLDESLFGPEGDDVFDIEYTEEDMARRPLWDSSMAEDLEALSREMNAGGGVRQSPAFLDDDYDDNNELVEKKDDEEREERDFKYEGMDPEEWFFQGSSDILEAPAREDLPDTEDSFGPPPEVRNEVAELAPHGPGLDGFLEAMIDHPTDYARVSLLKQHPAGQREPKPDFPKNRQPHPPLEFVEGHKRFLYVTGLPPLTINGEEGDLDNPVHRSLLEKLVGRLVDVDSTQVWPVNRTSAFVGFFTPRALADALKAGPTERVVSQMPHVALLSTVEGANNPFDDTEVERVVQLTHIHAGHTPSSLLRTLFPPDTEMETVYGSSLDASKDVYFLSSTKVLLRFPSAEQASSAITSQLWDKRLQDVSLYPVRYFRARRELVHAGFTGPVKDDEARVMGPRLIVDGDMPSKEFFQSHPRCLHVRNLDPVATTPEMLTEVFQPYSELPRQLGSIELVTCEEGMPTDRAYIGFDFPGEAEACIKACKGLIRVGDRKLLVRLVNDRVAPHQPLHRPEKRPARSTEELWDDLNNWEKYVDPADIEFLEKHGIPKVIVDEALRKIRRCNPTFGPLDNALRSEALEPETSPGELYRELVVMYVETLKGCVATPDDVGLMYEALHMPDEPIDLSIFDDWEKRKLEIEQSRASPS